MDRVGLFKLSSDDGSNVHSKDPHGNNDECVERKETDLISREVAVVLVQET
jgi:hypothetical protein